MATIPTLIGKNVVLRKIKEADIDDRCRIGKQHAYVHMCGGDSLSETEFPDRKVWESWYRNNKEAEHTWMIETGGHCIGTAGFHHIVAQDRCATYRIGIFDSAYHAKGLGTETTRLLLQYGFEVMGWHRIELRVLEYNHRAIRCYETCGFQKEGVLRENAFIDGTYYSDIIMSILEEEYRTAYGQ